MRMRERVDDNVTQLTHAHEDEETYVLLDSRLTDDTLLVPLKSI